MKVSKALRSIAEDEEVSGDSGNPDKWPCTIAMQALSTALQMERVCEAATAVTQTYLRGAVKPYEYEALCKEVKKLQQLQEADDE